MELSTKIITFAVALICYGMFFQADRIKFEMRLAEREAASHLTEAIVENTSEKIYLHKEALITNEDIIEAKVVNGYSPAVFDIEIVFTEQAAERVADATGKHIGEKLAILFNGKVIAAPIVQSKIRERGVISGQFSMQEAQRIARGIKSE